MEKDSSGGVGAELEDPKLFLQKDREMVTLSG